MKPFLSFLAFLIAAPAALFGQLPTRAVFDDPGAGARSHEIDQRHLRVELSFVPEQGLVRGRATHVFAPLRARVDSVWLDGPEIRYQEVKLNGRPVRHRAWPAGLSVYPDAPLTWEQTDTLEIRYEATPRHGMYFTGWNDDSGRARRQVWTQGQGPGNRHWVPFYDNPNDRLVTEIVVRFDRDYQVLSNGRLEGVRDHDDGTRSWHYRMPAPHPGYLMMLGIGRYAVQETASASGVPIRNYYYPDQPERAGPTYRYTAELLDALERQTGVPYPWGGYAQIPVHDFLHGGMENTGATVFSDAYYVDERGYLDERYLTVNAHELAHQWFGDLVTQGRSEDIWLHESFATHFGKTAEGAVLGEDHLEWLRKTERDRALSRPEQGPIPIRSTRAGSDLVYYKGSLVLDMLKDVVGRPAFDRTIREYLRRHAYGPVTGPDFFQAFDDVLGLNLDWFFDQWILRGGEPHYRVELRPVREGGRSFTEFTVSQIHQTGELVGYFRMPVDFEVHYEDGGVSSARAWVDGPETKVRVDNPEGRAVDFALFDPGHRLVKRLTFERSLEALAAQALHAPRMIDRYDAVEALGPAAPDEKRAALAAVFEREPFPTVRAEAVRQLAGDAASLPLLARALRDPHPAVRGAVLQHAPLAPALVRGFEAALGDSSYLNVQVALLRLAAGRPAEVSRWLDRTAPVEGIDHEVRIAWLEVAAHAGRAGAADSLVALSGPSYGFRTRLAAFSAIERLGLFDRRVAAHLVDAMAHFNRRLRDPAVGLYRRIAAAHEPAVPLVREAYRTRPWTEHQRDFLRPVVEG